jgi:outer membrane receptor for monomeric catechols
MTAKMLRTILTLAVCLCSGTFAVAGERPRHASPSAHGLSVSSRFTGTPKALQHASRLKRNVARRLAADRDPYADPAAPYKANRLSWWPSQPILNIPGQTTVITRQILDDTNATSLSNALGSAAGVTVGR